LLEEIKFQEQPTNQPTIQYDSRPLIDIAATCRCRDGCGDLAHVVREAPSPGERAAADGPVCIDTQQAIRGCDKSAGPARPRVRVGCYGDQDPPRAAHPTGRGHSKLHGELSIKRRSSVSGLLFPPPAARRLTVRALHCAAQFIREWVDALCMLGRGVTVGGMVWWQPWPVAFAGTTTSSYTDMCTWSRRWIRCQGGSTKRLFWVSPVAER
jgi:hypothetical protein